MRNKLEDEISGALARAYTTDENSSKELDSTLIFAMVSEVMNIFDKQLPSTVVLNYESFQKNGKKTITDLVNELIRDRDSRGR